jgi:hypothetical protein
MAQQLTLTDAQKAAIVADYRRRMKQCVPWSPATKWEPELNFVASSYTVFEAFPGIASSDAKVDELRPGQYVDSPGGEFRYCVRLHRAGRPLLTWWGSQVGTVIFDGDVIIPALFETRPENEGGEGRWNESPWMSLTPAEILTLRPGTRMAKGRVIVGGLGLGHQLIGVAKRLQVKHITLVELSRELVEWLLPQIRPHIKKPLDVVIGDAYEVIPTLSADVALVDIFPGYGNNQARVDELAARSPNVKKFWGWGTSEMSGRALE